MRASPLGFTLVELLIVVVVIGVLAAIVVPKYSAARENAYLAAVRSDLRVLASQQADYQADHHVFADDVDLLADFAPSEDVSVSISEANLGMGWAATASHDALSSSVCGIYFGNASADNAGPATSPGVVACPN